ncbi:MAG: hypothetical protein ACNA8W_18235 [Bradymonadaceae bacterium]
MTYKDDVQAMPVLVKVAWFALLVGFAIQGLVGYVVAFSIDSPAVMSPWLLGVKKV